MKIRMTHQTRLVLEIAQDLGHCTNNQILEEAKARIPEISATTVHRITKRLIEHGVLKKGPDFAGYHTIDSNLATHDHFVCVECQTIKDIKIDKLARSKILQQVPGVDSHSQLTITGDCVKCKKTFAF